MNQITLTGRLTREPEVRYNSDSFPVGHFTIAVDRDRKDRNGERGTDFVPVVVFGKQAEFAEKYLTKGRLVAVSGRLQVSSYEKDGQKRTKAEVLANNVEALDKPQEQRREPSGIESWGIDEEAFKF